MTKKLIISLSIIGVVAVAAIGATIAYYSDTETSTGNIFVAGTMDLKVDHIRQTYNDADCKTCSVEIKSDISNVVVSTVGGADGPLPHNAVVLSYIHPAWTVTGDIPGATWIWTTNPVLQADTTHDVYYTFRKTFEWWGPVNGVALYLGVGTDNGYQVKLNGTPVGSDWGEFNYRTPADVYINFGGLIVQGTNTLEIEVKNKGVLGSTPASNPAGLLYKLTINGNCGNDYFKTHCTLWGEKDLALGDYFWRLTDVKPGDRGTNIISMHVFDNNAFGCLLVTDPVDNENVCVDSENDSTCGSAEGELSQFLSAVLWMDNNPKDNAYNPGETILYGPALLKNMKNMQNLPLTATSTANIGLAWCLGTQTVDQVNGIISCSGAGNQDIAQTDIFLASLTAYAEQQRNNSGFNCASVVLP